MNSKLIVVNQFSLNNDKKVTLLKLLRNECVLVFINVVL